MRKLFRWVEDHFTMIYRMFLFGISVFLIVALFPRHSGFYYEYQQARPWMYEDLIAPFNFAILKTPQELQQEKKELKDNFIPFFRLEKSVYDRQLAILSNTFERLWEQEYPNTYQPQNKRHQSRKAIEIFDSIYSTGIIFWDNEVLSLTDNSEIYLLSETTAHPYQRGDFFTIREAHNFIREELQISQNINHTLLQNALENSLTHSVVWDEQINTKALEAELERISPSRGMVQQGEKIVSKGEVITDEKLRILDSFRAEYARQLGSTSANYLIFLGQLLLVSISMIVLSLFLKTFRKDVYFSTRKIALILVSIYLMVVLTSIVVKFDTAYLYLIPVCIVPIINRSFFDNRLALYVHIISIILIGFLVPQSFEFVFMQFTAGIIAILSMVSLRRRSQLFFTVFLVFITYSAFYTGLSLAQTGSFMHIDPLNYLYFAGSALFTLFAYPLIFMFERVSGLPTDFSLLELSDTNSPLLRELNMTAPGTFQHSLQVANLSEEAIHKIGGNSLMVRTGALYHDIGKMEQALYFTENQNTGVNPHDELSYTESAEIIINHVIKGIEKARKHNLPEYIIDFIRTHHGTTTARYFHAMEQKKNPDVEIDSEPFTYKGPKPFSKETAVVMMADSVEAASRSLRKPNEDSINDLVENIINTQMSENQFDNANITFKDISQVKQVLKNRLMHIFHLRIAYPKLN